ncbi:MAG: hypothetical protein KBB39_02910 [Phycicoccus sp.]|nr:hypothetical protein [Phycicoccus sp.]
MSFFDRAKAAATEAMAKADQAMSNAGLTPPGGMGPGVERALRDYGLLAWREAHGAAVDPGEKERVSSALAEAAAAGQLQHLHVWAPPAAPPPPGYAAQAGGAPPPPGAAPSGAGAPPPPPNAAPPAPPAAPPASPAVQEESTGPHGGSAPPPPPPSWA